MDISITGNDTKIHEVYPNFGNRAKENVFKTDNNCFENKKNDGSLSRKLIKQNSTTGLVSRLKQVKSSLTNIDVFYAKLMVLGLLQQKIKHGKYLYWAHRDFGQK